MLETTIDVEKIESDQFKDCADRDDCCSFMGLFYPEKARRCQICFEPMNSPTRFGSQSGGEHFKKMICNHEYCKTCVVSWVESNIEDCKHKINCPHDDCNFVMY